MGRGIPVSPGMHATGTLRRFRTPEDVIALFDEDELEPTVALVDDAGATFLAPIHGDLVGLVCLSGNHESHLAVVSRDFGTPALMSVEFIDAPPDDGTRVAIDTDAGTLSLDDRPAE